MLLGIPAIIAIHFLQQRSRSLRITTLFLLEQATPESRSGRTWERLRNSLALWCQLLAILLATWVLAEPRWQRSQSAITVVMVLDSSASMSAFRAETHRALSERISACSGLAEHTTWIVLPSDPKQQPLYRGPSAEQALASFDAWKPRTGSHDFGPALRLARSLAGSSGIIWLVTDSEDGVPKGQNTVGVGKSIPNVGFAGSIIVHENGRRVWKAFVQNRSDKAQERNWWMEAGSVRSPERKLSLAPGALTELSGPFPDGAGRCIIRLSPDAFALDDTLPLQRPMAKTLRVSVSLDGVSGDFFKKLIPTIEGLSLAPPAQAQFKIASYPPHGPRPEGPAILLNAAKGLKQQERISMAERVPAKHPLMADLNWQAWLGPGAEDMTLLPEDRTLLWQGDAPLLVLGPGADDVHSLLFNFHWDSSNAERLPATVLLTRRFLEEVRDARPGYRSANFDCGATLDIALRDMEAPGSCTWEQESLAQIPANSTKNLGESELVALRAPDEPGFFTLKRGDNPILRGAAQYADPREGDFSKASSFLVESQQEKQVLIERNTKADPFEKPALLLLALCLLLSWFVPKKNGTKNAKAI